LKITVSLFLLIPATLLDYSHRSEYFLHLLQAIFIQISYVIFKVDFEMNEQLKCLIIFVVFISNLVPFFVDLIRKQRNEDLPLEKLIVKILQWMRIYFYTLTPKLNEVFGISKNNFDLVLRFFRKLMLKFIICSFLYFCEIKRLFIINRLI